MTGLIVALDNPDLDQAEALCKDLSGSVAAFKVGLALFAARGPDAVRSIARYGDVFCDLKLHDIPHQVGLAAGELTRLGVWMLTVHASGGPAMISAAVKSAGTGAGAPLVAAVTVLTSLSAADLQATGMDRDPMDQAVVLARMATGAGAAALVCSPDQAAVLRGQLGTEVVLVTPGVRPSGVPPGDQARVMTPAQAAAAGASYLVVGRPITDAPDPVGAAQAVLEELEGSRQSG